MSAEAYGFGPVSKAMAIIRQLHALGEEIDFLAEGTALWFAQQENELFRVLDDSSKIVIDGATAELDLEGYDGVVSVMEPSIIAWGLHTGAPTYYVDSLYWMWEWDEIPTHKRYEAVAAIREASNREEAVLRMRALPMHLAQFVAHALADVSLVQRYGATAQSRARADIDPSPVGAIVDARFVSPETENNVLVSVSGSANPLVTPDLAHAWVGAVLSAVSCAHARSGVSAELLLAGNPDFLASGDAVIGYTHYATHHRHETHLATLGQTLASVAPPGITSLAEAWVYGVPFLSLPVQHYAHEVIWQRATAGNERAFPSLRVAAELTPDADVLVRTNEAVRAVIFALSGAAAAELTSEIEAGLRAVSDPRTRAQLVEDQDRALSVVFGSKTGTEEVVKVVRGSRACKVLNAPR